MKPIGKSIVVFAGIGIGYFGIIALCFSLGGVHQKHPDIYKELESDRGVVLPAGGMGSSSIAPPLAVGEPQTDPLIFEGEDDLWSDVNLNELSFLQSHVDHTFCQTLGRTAFRLTHKKRSKGYCFRWVRYAVNNTAKKYPSSRANLWALNHLPLDPTAGQKSRFSKRDMSISAETFRQWAKSNPIALCETLGFADVKHLSQSSHPLGAIYLYKKGTCGFHKKYGHAEIISQRTPLIACSDHCRKIKPQSCKPDMVLVPVTSCHWVWAYQKSQESLGQKVSKKKKFVKKKKTVKKVKKSEGKSPLKKKSVVASKKASSKKSNIKAHKARKKVVKQAAPLNSTRQRKVSQKGNLV